MSAQFFPGQGFPLTVERRIREWEQEEAEAGGRSDEPRIDYVCISRQIGSGGHEVGRILGFLMNWQLYDKDILNYMAENMQVHKHVLESVDERTVSWIHDALGSFFAAKPSQHVGQAKYFKHLVEVLLVIAKHGKAIIVGRAAGHVLPRDRGLSVRLTAPLELRIERTARKHDVSVKEAAAMIRKADKEQLRFVKSFIGKDAFDVTHFDVVLSTENLNAQSVAKIIWRAADERVNSARQMMQMAAQA